MKGRKHIPGIFKSTSMSVQAAEKHKDFILELNLKYFQKKLIFETCLNYFEQFGYCSTY